MGRSLSRPLLAAQVLGGTVTEPAGANGEAVQAAERAVSWERGDYLACKRVEPHLELLQMSTYGPST